MKTRHEIDLLSTIKKLNGLVKIVYDERLQTYAILKIDGKYYKGISKLSSKDKFDKKLGRVIALGRAMLKYKNNDNIELENLPNILRFKSDRTW